MAIGCNTSCCCSVDTDNFYYEIINGCTKCGSCKRICSANAIDKVDGKFTIDQNLCTKCGRCVSACPLRVIVTVNSINL